VVRFSDLETGKTAQTEFRQAERVDGASVTSRALGYKQLDESIL